MQQINLYVAELRPQKDWLAAKYLLAALFGIFFVLFMMHYIKSHEVSRLEASLEEKQLVLKALEIELDKSKSASAPSSRADIEQNIVNLEQKITSRERLARLIQGQTVGESFSFQKAMTALAESATPRVSLNQFTFSEGGRLVEMRGVGMETFDVPELFGKLRRVEPLSQAQFGLLRIGSTNAAGNIEFTMGYDGSKSFSTAVEQ